jgi:hypothetical protein
MAIHPELAAYGIAYGMVDMLRRAGQLAADRRDQHVMDAWHATLVSAQGNAAALRAVAVEAAKRVVVLTAEVEDLEAENARLRALLKERNAMIRALAN